MTNQEMKDTIRQMLKDWNAATEGQRQEALEIAARSHAVPSKGVVLFFATLKDIR